MKTPKNKIAAAGSVAAAILFAITGCASQANGAGAETSENKTENISVSEEKVLTENENTEMTVNVNTLSNEISELVPEIALKEFELPENEALSFVRDLKAGWNLGNTFDAYDCTWLENELEYESAWCGAVTTETHIETAKQAGFKSIRIPVSWHNHITNEEDYTISKAWLNRVTEVVNYCIDRDLYVIINIHHDNSKDFLYPTNELLEQSTKYVTSIWKQLSENFRDYSEKLIFAAMNEPRLVGHKNEWWIDNNSKDCKDAIECINKLNQAFVDTVRASGGNNESRYLICPGYAASPDGVLNDGFKLPEDPVGSNNNRIIVSVHSYTPYNFALEEGGTSEWSIESKRDVASLTGFMDKVYDKFVSKGIPVVIDEFGARNKNNTAARTDFTAYYTAAARARGMSCFWWDNNAVQGSGELFGILDRKNNEWAFPEIVQAIMKYAE